MFPTDHTFNIPAMTQSERILLAQQLLDSIAQETAPLSAEQLAEVRRRTAEIDSGEAVCIPLDEVMESLRRAR